MERLVLIFVYFISTDGFLFVEDLLAHPQFHSYTLEDVERVVATNDKQRFKLRSHPDNGRLEIRANQGHSIQVGINSGRHKGNQSRSHFELLKTFCLVWLLYDTQY